MQSKAMVDANGTVFWPPPAKLRSTCKIDITYFPFDDQICTMKFGSWTYDGYQVNITKKREEVDFQNYVQSGEWNLIRIDVERQETVYPISPVPYPDIKFHIAHPVLPVQHHLPLPVAHVLLAFSVFMLLIAENMPATSEFVPLIGIYLTVTMSTTSLSIVLTVFVLHLHHIGPNDKPVPPRLKHFFFNLAARMLCMSSVTRYQKRARKRRQKFDECRQQQQQPEEVELLGTSTSPQPAVADQQPRKVAGSPGSCNGQFLTAADNAIMEEDNRRGTIANRGATDDSPTASAATAAGPSGLARPQQQQQQPASLLLGRKYQEYDHVYRHLRRLIRRQVEEEAAQLLINDWRMLAFIVDRMLFWLFLVAAFGSTIVILVIMPLFKETGRPGRPRQQRQPMRRCGRNQQPRGLVHQHRHCPMIDAAPRRTWLTRSAQLLSSGHAVGIRTMIPTTASDERIMRHHRQFWQVGSQADKVEAILQDSLALGQPVGQASARRSEWPNGKGGGPDRSRRAVAGGPGLEPQPLSSTDRRVGGDSETASKQTRCHYSP
uniref:Neur_chan_LBD domain-containing protein n=1 Tax=Macrostomum lignano TaxID=282301 RepID=A0A1I8JSE8_9PLAT